MQAFENKDIPLRPPVTPNTDLGQDPATKKTRRCDVDVLSTVAWVRYLQHLSQSKSAYALGRLIESDAYWRTEEGIGHHRNKWSKYQKGQHRPRSTLVNTADRLFPGSAQVINSMFWVILKNTSINQNQISKIESKLSAEVKLVVEKWRNNFRNGRNPGIRRLAHKLEIIHNLDALAVMMLMCQSCYTSNNEKDAHEWSRYIYRYMAINSEFFHISGVKEEIFEKINEVLLQKIKYKNLRYTYPLSMYSTLHHYLMVGLSDIGNLDYANIKTREIIFHARKSLNGNYGWDLQAAFNPILEIIDKSSIDQELLEDQIRIKYEFDYAWEVLKQGRIKRYPPEYHLPLKIP